MAHFPRDLSHSIYSQPPCGDSKKENMKRPFIRLASTALVAALTFSRSNAAPLGIRVETPLPPVMAGYKMGDSLRPDGTTLTLDSHSLLLNGRPWTPVMGEFHYSRIPANEWREELLKMKAGGVDIVSTYVFWIHHEEIEGQFDWSERRDLRRFVQLCGEVGLRVIVRCGPWCHGEVRNGGEPDWLLQKGWKLRSDDPPYLDQVKILYAEIAKQLAGLLWKNGGPVIGVQFENEYSGPASHLLTLKKIGRAAGLDVPIYTRTGWNNPSGKMPFGELVPLYGVYAEGFWDRVLTPMPAGYWKGFNFSTFRVDDATFREVPGKGGRMDPPDVARYPYLTCEIGGGMMNSYHRRILVNPADVESLTLVKIGSGSVLPGYYMYHGGENPDGKLTTLQESQATGYWNDLPVKNYDFQAPLGEYGQIRPQYHLLRRLHLFLHEWGASLAGMGVALPDQRPVGKDDTNTLRWSVRSDGQSGFVFVNNYERLRDLPAKTNVQFALKLPAGTLIFPKKAVTIPAGDRFFWPFNFDLGGGIKLISATAQPLCAVDDNGTRTVFFAETKGVPAEFVFDRETPLKSSSAKISLKDGRLVVSRVQPGRKPALQIAKGGGRLQIVLLSDADSLALWQGNWQGRDRVFLSKAGVVLDGDNIRLTATNRDDLRMGIYPAPGGISCQGKLLCAKNDGLFRSFMPDKPQSVALRATYEEIQAAGPPRAIPLGKIKEAVAAAPVDADFAQAAIWRISLPEKTDMDLDPILRLNYVGDVARISLNGKLLTDDFYNGNQFEVGLRRYAPEILRGDLRLAILPLRKDAPIYLASQARPNFGKAQSVAELRGVQIIPRYTVQLTAQ
jgi:beta-galactosidase